MTRRHLIDWFMLRERHTRRRPSFRPAIATAVRPRLRFESLEERRLLAVFTVSDLGDDEVTMAGDAPGTLRQAIFDANQTAEPDTIQFSAGLSGMILLTEGELSITTSLNIQGPSAAQLTIEAFDPTPDEDNGDGSRVLNIDDGGNETFVDVTVSGLTLTGGDASVVGGAIRNTENLTVVRSHVTGNSAFSTSGILAAGGGIYSNLGTLTVEHSTISENRVYHDDFAAGGGIAAGLGNITIRNSTISGNEARAQSGATGGDGYGGGILLGTGNHLIAHSTIAENRATGSDSYGGGIAAFGTESDVILTHTIVSDNRSEQGDDIASDTGLAITARFSLVSDSTGWVLNDEGNNIFDVSAELTEELADFGGTTPVLALLPGSPAIDAGDPLAVPAVGGVPLFDQRRVPFSRIADGDDDPASVIDIGAYEVQAVAGLNLVVDTIVDEVNGDLEPGGLSLREAVGLANGSVGGDTITFSPLLSGKTILLSKGELQIFDDVTIDAVSQAGVVIIDASGNDRTPKSNNGDGSRIFTIDPDDIGIDAILNVELRGLFLTGGDVSDDGGAIYSRDNLRLDQVTLAGNYAADEGGGLMQRGRSNTTLEVANSTISGNEAVGRLSISTRGYSADGGGGIFVSRSDTLITGSTISGNRTTGEEVEGGGVASIGNSLTIRHSTLTGNVVTEVDGQGGNLFFRYGDDLVLDHTIVANGVASEGNDIFSPFDPVMANDSLIEDVTGLTVQGAGNVTGSDPLLGPLVENGGPTKTHGISSTSPALDGGDFTFTPPPEVDQRGGPFVRVFDGNDDSFSVIDIGAYERQTLPELSLVVDTLADEYDGIYTAGDLSLREAIGLANGSVGSDTITFAPQLLGKTILLTLGELTIVDDTVIDATNLGGSLTIDATGNDDSLLLPQTGSRILTIDDGDTLSHLDITLSGLTLTGGDVAGNGGAIRTTENLTINASTIQGNNILPVFTGGSGAPSGGGIFISQGPTVTLNDSTVSGNAANSGGGIAIDEGELILNSSTISTNLAASDGGGVWAVGADTDVTANHSTIANNRSGAGNGGGVFSSNSGSISLNHTIVADNTTGIGTAPDVFSTDDVPFFNSLVEDPAGFTPTGGPQQIGVDPILGPLADNGGPARTHALGVGSVAIDAGMIGFAGPPDFDQRGGPFVRVFDGNGDEFSRIDIGAYERQVLEDVSLVVDTTSDVINGDFGPGDLSLREAVALANGSVGDDTITFAPNISGTTITLVQGELTIIESLVIEAIDLPQNVTIDASGSDPTPDLDNGDGSRVLLINDNDQFTQSVIELSGLNLIGGDIAGVGGGILTDEDLALTESTVSGNAASPTDGDLFGYAQGSGDAPTTGQGGGIAAQIGDLRILDSTISGNSATGAGHGAGIVGFDTQIRIGNSTISGNTATGDGGGISVRGSSYLGLFHSTVSGNTAGNNQNGGGIYVQNGVNFGLDHTIVANNQAGFGPDIFSDESVPLVFSLVEDTDGFTPIDGPRITGQDPQLGPLADNGGPTLTHALLPGSPAIDAGELGIVFPPDFDQRGAPLARIVDGNDDTFTVIDMGAFEFNLDPVGLVGDYNSDLVVDLADYTVFRDTLGSTTDLRADGDNSGVIDAPDYDVWKMQFGSTAASASGSASVVAETTDLVGRLPVLFRSLKAVAAERSVLEQGSAVTSVSSTLVAAVDSVVRTGNERVDRFAEPVLPTGFTSLPEDLLLTLSTDRQSRVGVSDSSEHQPLDLDRDVVERDTLFAELGANLAEFSK